MEKDWIVIKPSGHTSQDVQLCVVILGPPWRPPKCQAIWRKERSFKVTRRPVWVSRSRRRNVSDVLGQLEFGIRQKFGEKFCWLLTKWKKNSTLFENLICSNCEFAVFTDQRKIFLFAVILQNLPSFQSKQLQRLCHQFFEKSIES